VGGIGHHRAAHDLTDRASLVSQSGPDRACLNSVGPESANPVRLGIEALSAAAVGLLSDADLVAGVASFGTALALAVLALEVSVKARTLGAIAAAAAQGRPPGFSDEELRKIVYSGHRERHDAGFLQHVAAAFSRCLRQDHARPARRRRGSGEDRGATRAPGHREFTEAGPPFPGSLRARSGGFRDVSQLTNGRNFRDTPH
jgi:AbiV